MKYMFLPFFTLLCSRDLRYNCSQIQYLKGSSTVFPAAAIMVLSQVNAIGEKRGKQLKALGINSAAELSEVTAKTVAKKPCFHRKLLTNGLLTRSY